MPKKQTKPTMSQAFSDLEKIVAEFEEGNIDLEESLPRFKKGLELAKFLKKRLKTLENEIIEIRDEFGETEEENEVSDKSKDGESEMEDELPF